MLPELFDGIEIILRAASEAESANDADLGLLGRIELRLDRFRNIGEELFQENQIHAVCARLGDIRRMNLCRLQNDGDWSAFAQPDGFASHSRAQ